MGHRALEPSTQTLRWPPPTSPETPLFLCHGDSDEHLRLGVLIASALGTPATTQAVDAARSPRSSWATRSRALEEILARAEPPPTSGLLGILVDLDAAVESVTGNELGWDDATFRGERREFVELMLRAVAAGGWLLVRPDPCVELSLRLEDVGAFDDASEVAWMEPSAFSAAVREIVSALLDERQLDEAGVERWEHQDKPTSEILEFALDHAARHVIDTGARLAHERLPLELNGRCGPFLWEGEHTDRLTVERSAVDSLIRHGFLLATAVGDRAPRWMPRIIRRAFLARGREAAEGLHGELSRRRGVDAPAESIEAHWHAIAAGDADRALATARYYVSDLREIAKAHSANRRWREAADVYAKILEHDESDAYAWEYWGYNLARLDDEASSPRHVEDIEHAYERAHKLALRNPLYHGRMLGFALRRRTATIEDANRVCAYYRKLYGQSAVEWFGWQVAQALRHRGDPAQAASFCTRWRIEAPASSQKLPRQFGAGPRGIVIGPGFDDPMPEFELESGPV